MHDSAPQAATQPETGRAPVVTGLRFDNSYARLPAVFFSRQDPTPVASPRLIALNRPLAESLGLDPDTDPETLAQVFAGNRLPEGAEPLAMVYAGHQFGGFVPRLGDGRAILLGEVVDRRGVRRDIQLKGAGRTRFSRHGDGRAPVGPVLREYLVSEALHGLGIPSTRSLALVTTGEQVLREQPEPGAILTRVARSHIRVGTFEYFAARREDDRIRRLADYVVHRHYPELATAKNPYLTLLDTVVSRQAKLVAQWMQVGFIHGVMNTDNMSLAGETLDYGPCAFMEQYHPNTVFSFIDRGGRYAYSNQPKAAQWNLARLAECLLPLIDEDEDRAIAAARESVEAFMPQYEQAWLDGMRRKIGLARRQEGDRALVEDLLTLLQNHVVDFTGFFRALTAHAKMQKPEPLLALFREPQGPSDWLERWQQRMAQENTSPGEVAEAMATTNPAVIPRNHKVEEAIEAARDRADFEPFQRLREALARPYDETEANAPYRQPAPPDQAVRTTFCGT